MKKISLLFLLFLFVLNASFSFASEEDFGTSFDDAWRHVTQMLENDDFKFEQKNKNEGVIITKQKLIKNSEVKKASVLPRVFGFDCDGGGRYSMIIKLASSGRRSTLINVEARPEGYKCESHGDWQAFKSSGFFEKVFFDKLNSRLGFNQPRKDFYEHPRNDLEYSRTGIRDEAKGYIVKRQSLAPALSVHEHFHELVRDVVLELGYPWFEFPLVDYETLTIRFRLNSASSYTNQNVFADYSLMTKTQRRNAFDDIYIREYIVQFIYPQGRRADQVFVKVFTDGSQCRRYTRTTQGEVLVIDEPYCSKQDDSLLWKIQSDIEQILARHQGRL